MAFPSERCAINTIFGAFPGVALLSVFIVLLDQGRKTCS